MELSFEIFSNKTRFVRLVKFFKVTVIAIDINFCSEIIENIPFHSKRYCFERERIAIFCVKNLYFCTFLDNKKKTIPKPCVNMTLSRCASIL